MLVVQTTKRKHTDSKVFGALFDERILCLFGWLVGGGEWRRGDLSLGGLHAC